MNGSANLSLCNVNCNISTTVSSSLWRFIWLIYLIDVYTLICATKMKDERGEAGRHWLSYTSLIWFKRLYLTNSALAKKRLFYYRGLLQARGDVFLLLPH